jgi:hypothetical protein
MISRRHIFRFCAWLFLWCAVAYPLFWIPTAYRAVTKHGFESPGMWKSLVALVILCAGALLLGIVMVAWTKNEVAAFLKKRREVNPTSQPKHGEDQRAK